MQNTCVRNVEGGLLAGDNKVREKLLSHYCNTAPDRWISPMSIWIVSLLWDWSTVLPGCGCDRPVFTYMKVLTGSIQCSELLLN